MSRLGRGTWLLFALAVSLAAPPARAAIKETAINVAVYGFEYQQNLGAAVNTLEANGYGATAVTLTDIAAGLPGYDVLYVTHPYDAGGWSLAACNGMKAFLAKGKGVVFEWDGAILPFTSLGPNVYVNASPQCALFKGAVDRGKSVGFNTPITITDPGSPLTRGLTGPIAMGAASDYMYQVTGYDATLWKVPATYSGWAQASNPALMYARYKDTGCVAVGTMALGDNGYSTLLETSSRSLFLNMIATAAPGTNSCVGAPFAEGFPIPAASPFALLALLMLLGASGAHWRRRAVPRR